MNENWVTFHFDEKKPLRLDKFLVSTLPDYSRSRIQSFIKDGYVFVNGIPAHKTGQILETGTDVEVHIPAPTPTNLVPEAIPLEIIYENGDLMVINKPAGMVVHPAIGHATGTLVHAALAHAPNIEGVGERKDRVSCIDWIRTPAD